MKFATSKYFILLFLIANMMGSVRYVFRWGDPASSHTYDNVPSGYFLFWNILTVLMAIIALKNIQKISRHVVIIGLFVLIGLFVCYLQTKSFYVKGSVHGLILCAFFFIAIYSNSTWINVKHVNRAIEFLAVYGIAFIIFQIALYMTLGMLPAHSLKGKLVRLGSYYDDSLVLGIVLPMFAGYYFNKYRKVSQRLITGLLFNLAALGTGSLTAIGVAFLYTLWSYRDRPYLIVIYVLSGLLIIWLIHDQLLSVIMIKSESIGYHLAGFTMIKELNLTSILGLKPLDIFVESGFLLILLNLGLPVLLIIIWVHLRTLFEARSFRETGGDLRAFSGATEGITFSILFSSLNLPVIIISPVYLIAAIFSGIILDRKNHTK